MQYRVVDVPFNREALSADAEAITRAVDTAAIEATESAFSLRRRNELKPFDTLVFRLSVDVDWSAYQEVAVAIIKSLHERRGRNPENPQKALYSAAYNVCFADVLANELLEDSPDLRDELEAIQRGEFLEIVRASDALFEHGRSILFGLPSGRLSDYFFRTGNLQINYRFTTAAFFWSLESLEQVDHIAADTWSISTTAARFADLLSNYAGGDRKTWSYLTEYLPNSVEAVAEFRRTLGALVDGSPGGSSGSGLLFLCSFSASGKLKNFVNSLVEEFSGELNSKFISLFAAEDGPMPLCSIKPILDEIELSGSDHGVKDPNIRIRDISAASYFPDYRSPEPERFLVADAADKAFFERYSGHEIFSVFKTGSSGSYFSNSGSDTKGRHHAFHIDARRLIGSEPFGMRLKQLVSAKFAGENDGVLVVPNQTGCLFLESFCTAASISKHNINIFSVPSLGIEAPEQELIDFLQSGKKRTLYVLVPISITGYSLQRLQVRLREIVEGPENIQCNIHLFLGVLRPPDQRKIDEISRFFFNQEGSSRTGSVQISVVESVVLPNWQEHQCPWTRELRAISRTLKNESLPPEIDRLFRARLRVLRSSAATGLRTKDVFFVPFDDPHLVFNSGSRFLDRAKMFLRRPKINDSARNAFSGLSVPDASEADLNCAVASSIQRWRERVGRTSLNPVCIDASTISNNNGFNESKLRAALWRSLTPTELRYGSRSGSDFVSMVDRVFQSGSNDTNFTKLELEAILAFGREVPRVCSTTIADWHWRETRYLARHTR